MQMQCLGHVRPNLAQIAARGDFHARARAAGGAFVTGAAA
jgi:hypothetical protein